MKNIIFIAISAVFFTSCSGKSSVIYSYEMISKKYPQSKYMSAWATGKTEFEAKEQAKAEISNIFESKIMSSVSSRVSSFINNSGAEVVSREAEQVVKVVSSVSLKGLEIAESWKDEKEGHYIALAVLDRVKSTELWLKDADDLDRNIEAELAVNLKNKSKFASLKSLNLVRKHWLEREVIAGKLKVIGSEVNESSYNIRHILKDIAETKSSLKLFVGSGDNRYSVRLAAEISEKLTGAGYRIVENEKNAHVAINASVIIEPVKMENRDWEFARARASVTITDNESGLRAGEIEEDKRASHLSYEEASGKASKSVTEMVLNKMTDFFPDIAGQ